MPLSSPKPSHKDIDKLVDSFVEEGSEKLKEYGLLLESLLENDGDSLISENEKLVSFLCNYLQTLKPCAEAGEQALHNEHLESIVNVAMLTATNSVKTKVFKTNYDVIQFQNKLGASLPNLFAYVLESNQIISTSLVLFCASALLEKSVENRKLVYSAVTETTL